MSSLLKFGLTFQSPLPSFPASCGFYVDCTQNSGFLVSRPAMFSFDVMIRTWRWAISPGLLWPVLCTVFISPVHGFNPERYSDTCDVCHDLFSLTLLLVGLMLLKEEIWAPHIFSYVSRIVFYFHVREHNLSSVIWRAIHHGYQKSEPCYLLLKCNKFLLTMLWWCELNKTMVAPFSSDIQLAKETEISTNQPSAYALQLKAFGTAVYQETCLVKFTIILSYVYFMLFTYS